MRLRRRPGRADRSRVVGRRDATTPSVVSRRARGRAGLVVGLHGYGVDERQLETLVPLDLPVVRVDPRAPVPTETGWSWWRPETDPITGSTELAPRAGVDAAVDEVRRRIVEAQVVEGIGPDRTVLVGYSQGATLALSVAARHPELVAGVATGAGFLLPFHEVRPPDDDPLRVLILNGSLDRFVTADDHANTVDRFTTAGHRVTERRDPVPHVVDAGQVAAITELVADVVAATPSPRPR